MDLSNHIISSIQAISRRYPVNRIVLFGSRARGDNEFNSTGHFSSDVEDIKTLLKIDLVFVDERTETALLERISREGVILYERSSSEIG